MDRRESLKTLFVGSLAGGLAVTGCEQKTTPELEVPVDSSVEGYGRTPKEQARDEQLFSTTFFTSHEMETLATLCDLILPPGDGFVSATAAGVPEFMEFIVKDIPTHQIPIRGGVMWIDSYSNNRFGLEFKKLEVEQQRLVCDDIAYPDITEPSLQAGIAFFSLVRDLTLTGFYTSKPGIEELGYKGNTPNVWDGVPDEVLKAHGMSYDDELMPRYVDQSKRTDVASWDDAGNLLT
ncbi:MAG: gluconate 2-dehydrogenase subunit 3 family protein [Bacteroidota bacterium]